nr:MAG TPA: hypothetical protein [Caudoviricetes sp.]
MRSFISRNPCWSSSKAGYSFVSNGLYPCD